MKTKLLDKIKETEQVLARAREALEADNKVRAAYLVLSAQELCEAAHYLASKYRDEVPV